jgi:photosystem II stability/assembly factor-like uncharacterized protein
MAQRTYAIFVANYAAPIWISDDQGATWSNPLSTGLPSLSAVKNITVDSYNGYNSIVSSTFSGLFKSTDGGETYSQIPFTSVPLLEVQYINSLNVIAVGAGILRSNDGGNTFVSNSFDPVAAYGPGAVYTPTYYANNIFFDTLSNGFISIHDKIFKSFDGGATWIPLNGGNPISSGFPIKDIVANSSTIVAITEEGIYQSTDAGLTFTNVQPLLFVTADAALDIIGSSIYAFDSSGLIWVSTDAGATFTNVNSIATSGAYRDIFAHTASRVTFVSDDSGLPSTGALFLTTDSGATVNVVEDVDSRAYALDASLDVPCGECLPKFTFNPVTGLCELDTSSTPLCPDGYAYNEITKTCDKDGEESIVAPNCPPGCNVSLGTNGRGYCICIESFSFIPCCYELTDCAGLLDPIYTKTDLSDYESEGNIIKIQGSNACWQIQKLEDLCTDDVTVIVTDVFESCLACGPSYALYNCEDQEEIIYTIQDLQANLSKTVQLVEYPNKCWQIGPNPTSTFVPETVTISEVFDSCDECIPEYYVLSSCEGDITIYALPSDELLASDGLVAQIDIEGEPTCFSVEKIQGFPPEEPIEVTVVKGKFADCVCCLPQPAPEPEVFVRTTQKPVKKFYHITDSECEIRTNVKFANNYAKLFNTIKNGMGNCCGDVDLDKLWIEKELSDYSRINPPGECVPPPIPAEPEECPVPPISLCEAPENVSGTGNIN